MGPPDKEGVGTYMDGGGRCVRGAERVSSSAVLVWRTLTHLQQVARPPPPWLVHVPQPCDFSSFHSGEEAVCPPTPVWVWPCDLLWPLGCEHSGGWQHCAWGCPLLSLRTLRPQWEPAPGPALTPHPAEPTCGSAARSICYCWCGTARYTVKLIDTLSL